MREGRAAGRNAHFAAEIREAVATIEKQAAAAIVAVKASMLSHKGKPTSGKTIAIRLHHMTQSQFSMDLRVNVEHLFKHLFRF